mmetsp:Transcript_105590/g.256425  ORF Transcript_105590/g.256425 Transcript_105590/m.256425 type:complete len:260 (+) Transcript_105590:1363-2142(+)
MRHALDLLGADSEPNHLPFAFSLGCIVHELLDHFLHRIQRRLPVCPVAVRDMPMEELKAQGTFFDRNHTLIVRLLLGRCIHKAIDHLTFALAGINVLLHTRFRGIDGHGTRDVSGAVSHNNVRHVHVELGWVACLADKSLPEPIKGRRGDLRRCPAHADDWSACSSGGLLHNWRYRLILCHFPCCTQASCLKPAHRILKAWKLLDDVALDALLVLCACPKVGKVRDGLKLEGLGHVRHNLGINPGIAGEELSERRHGEN